MTTLNAIRAFVARAAAAAFAHDPAAPLTARHVLKAGEGRLPQLFACLRREDIALVSAHRGGAGPGFPENSLVTAERTALAAPVMIELDVRATYDGVLVLSHDETLERTSNGKGKIQDLTFDEFRSLKLKDTAGNLTAQSPDTFEAALKWSKEKSLLRIDLKSPAGADRVVAAVRKAGAEGRVIYTTYTLAQSRRVLDLSPAAMVTMIIRERAQLDEARRLGLLNAHVQALVRVGSDATRLYRELAAAGVSVAALSYGEDSPEERYRNTGDAQVYLDAMRSGLQVLSANAAIDAARALLTDPAYRAKLRRCGIG